MDISFLLQVLVFNATRIAEIVLIMEMITVKNVQMDTFFNFHLLVQAVALKDTMVIHLFLNILNAKHVIMRVLLVQDLTLITVNSASKAFIYLPQVLVFNVTRIAEIVLMMEVKIANNVQMDIFFNFPQPVKVLV